MKEMQRIKESICENLKGSTDGVRCEVLNCLVRINEDADLWLRMNRHHEACAYYVLSLRELVLDATDSKRVLGVL